MIRKFFVAFAVLVSSGCATLGDVFNPNFAPSQVDAGEVHISAYPPIPWTTIVDDLSPNFTVASADKLLEKVAPTTFSDVYSRRRALGAGFEVGLPGTSTAVTQTVDEALNTETGETETISDTTNTVRTRTAASRPDDLTPSIDVSDDDPVSNAFSADIDPRLQYRVAAGLKQEIELLNRYLKQQVASNDFVPYLVRLQVTLLPFARNQPYDAYLRISTDTPEFSASPRIIPLLITDNFERSNSRRLFEAASQLEANLSAVTSGVGLGAGIRSALEEIRGLAGANYNTLQTLSQDNPNEAILRIGAAYSTEAQYVMRTQSYDISFVLLWPASGLSTGDVDISIFAESEFRRPQNGRPLEKVTIEQFGNLRSRLRKAIENEKNYSDGFVWNSDGDTYYEIFNYRHREYDNEFDSVGGELEKFLKCLEDERDDPPLFEKDQTVLFDKDRSKKCRKDVADGLWAAFEFQSREQATNLFNIRHVITRDQRLIKEIENIFEGIFGVYTQATLTQPNCRMPESSIGLYSDNGNDFIVTLGDASGLSPTNYKAFLHVSQDIKIDQDEKQNQSGNPDGDDKLRIAYKKIAISGETMSIQFPSLKRIKNINRQNPHTMELLLRKDSVCYQLSDLYLFDIKTSAFGFEMQDNPDFKPSDSDQPRQIPKRVLGPTYKLFETAAPSIVATAERSFKARTIDSKIVTDKDKSGVARLVIETPKKANPEIRSYKVTIGGYPVASVKKIAGSAAVTLSLASNSFKASGAGVFDIAFGALKAGDKIEFKVEGLNVRNKVIDGETQNLSLTIAAGG